MVLTAVSEGLGTCCVGSFSEKDVKETLKIPDNYEVIVMITVGYAARKTRPIQQTAESGAYKKNAKRSLQRRNLRQSLVPQKIEEH